MAREHRAARKSGPRTNLYDDITDKIIAELEEGRLPWVQPWGTAAVQAPLAMPRNASTGRQYSGINVLILAHTDASGRAFRQHPVRCSGYPVTARRRH